MVAAGMEERGYTERATDDLLLKVLEKEFREAMQDVLEERRKITDPDVCNIFNLWYLRNHVNDIQKEMYEGFAVLRHEMVEHFKTVDEQFAQMRREMNGRFEKMEARISQIFIFLGVGFTILAALITIFQFTG
ncbi:MAG: hypothetical protein WAV32_07095 [Halobacteriota archaeon]